MNNLWNIIPSILTLVAGGGWLFDRRRHRQEVESLKADNRQKDMNLSKMYVDEFKENIADRFLSREQSKFACFAEALKRV